MLNMLTRRQRALLCLQEENELIPLGRTQVRAWRKAQEAARATVSQEPVALLAPAPAPAPACTWTWKPMAMKASKFPVTDVPVPYSVEFVSTWYSDISEDEEEKVGTVTVTAPKHKIKTKKERLLSRC
jgi:hypothetical protein